MAEKLCYNCGCVINNDNNTVEHIPAKNLYTGYGDEYKVNRITVPACRACNEQYSKIDQDIRDLIGISNDDIDKDVEFTRKSVKSILRKGNWKDRIYVTPNGVELSVDFSYDDLKTLHIKNFKGLFFKKYGYPLPDEYEVAIIADGDDDIENAGFLYQYLEEEKDWQVSGHPDIFKYKLKTFTPNEDGTIADGNDLSKALGIVGMIVYHDKLAAVIVAAKKTVLQDILKHRK